MSGLPFAQHRARFAAANTRRLVSIRRRIHAEPELAWQEHHTQDLVREVLSGWRLQPTMQYETALIYDIRTGSGEGDGPTIALRADMDALPIHDEKQVAYRSKVPGVAHACGHDVHTAILVGVGQLIETGAHLLPEGRVRLIFQPAEETVPGGALRLTTEVGVMEGIDAIFALHCDPGLPTGTIGLRAGPITSACDQIRIVLEGPGGHTARPQLTTDLVCVASLVGVQLPALVAQKGDDHDRAAVVFGAVHAGATHNVIPASAELLGTVRTRTRSAWEAAPWVVAEALRQVTSGFDVGCNLDHERGAPPVENDPLVTELVARGCRNVPGTSICEVGQSPGAEDFSWYLSHASGSYLRLGVGSRDVHIDLHSGAFDADEAAIPCGVQVLASVVEVALRQLAVGAKL